MPDKKELETKSWYKLVREIWITVKNKVLLAKLKVFSFLSSKQRALIEVRTPPWAVRQRKGPQGIKLSYVEGQYVIRELNRICGYFWSFNVIDWKEKEDHITVLGSLMIGSTENPSSTITKQNFGSSDIKRYPTKIWDKKTGIWIDSPYPKAGKIICWGDDYKAATTDCLKKCASMFGIALDIYGGTQETWATDGQIEYLQEILKVGKLNKNEKEKLNAHLVAGFSNLEAQRAIEYFEKVTGKKASWHEDKNGDENKDESKDENENEKEEEGI